MDFCLESANWVNFIVLVFDGSPSYTSPDVLDGFTFAKNSSLSLFSRLRSEDRLAIVNGSFSVGFHDISMSASFLSAVKIEYSPVSSPIAL